MEATKREWTPPTARPITAAGSRADVQDVPAPNGLPISQTPN
jgi:hypothetical protein